MDGFLNRIYNSVLIYEKDAIRLNEQVDKEINQLAADYLEQLDINESEELKDLLVAVTLIAEQAGFENGIRFVMKLICSLFLG